MLALPFLLAFIYSASAAWCHATVPPHGATNDFPILDLTKLDPKYVTLVTQVENGKLFRVTVPNGNPNATSSFYLTHLYGSYYDMGLAQGQLLTIQIENFIEGVYDFFLQQLEDKDLPGFLPPWFKTLIATYGLDAALDLVEIASESYTDPSIFAELKGIADGSGCDYKKLLRVQMIPGYTQGHCSMFGLWDEALDPSYRDNLLQLRALDWNIENIFTDNAAITVYHPTDGSNSHINIGMLGFIGGLTGISSTQLGISQIGASLPDNTFGDQSRIGVPFVFLLRDILRYDITIDDAINRMLNSKRTCDLMLGVGDGKLKQFRGMQYSSSVLNVFDDINLQPFNETWHPRIPKAVYWGMDWDCPAYNTALADQLKKWYGKITPEVAIKHIPAVEKSGDLHIAIYDLTAMQLWVSFAAPGHVGGPKPAYARQYAKFDATGLLNQK